MLTVVKATWGVWPREWTTPEQVSHFNVLVKDKEHLRHEDWVCAGLGAQWAAQQRLEPVGQWACPCRTPLSAIHGWTRWRQEPGLRYSHLHSRRTCCNRSSSTATSGSTGGGVVQSKKQQSPPVSPKKSPSKSPKKAAGNWSPRKKMKDLLVLPMPYNDISSDEVKRWDKTLSAGGEIDEEIYPEFQQIE